MIRLTSSSYSDSPLVNAHTHGPLVQHVSILQKWATETIVPDQYCSFGIHPKDTGRAHAWLPELESKLNFPEVVAIGETGLDNRLEISMEEQEVVYIAHLQLAEKHNLPVILHCVGSWDRCRKLHQHYAPKQLLIYHGFSKPSITEKVRAYPTAIFGIGEHLLHSEPLREAVKHLPLDRILLETDGADVDILELYELLAAIKSLPLPAVIDQLYTNFRSIFDHGKLA